jgi:Phosphotransferase enzyme family
VTPGVRALIQAILPVPGRIEPESVPINLKMTPKVRQVACGNGCGIHDDLSRQGAKEVADIVVGRAAAFCAAGIGSSDGNRADLVCVGSSATSQGVSGQRLGCGGVSEGELLIGDGVTQGIVRIGDTVRRPLRPFSLTVQAYLAHLRDAGFTGAPLPLGVDEQGREMLSFVPGDVPRNPLPAETAGDEVLVALARLIRTLHEASAGWAPPPDAVWGGTPANLGRPIVGRTELVTHRDYYPGNVVFRDGLPVALIDFDLARPTTRLYDIANALWYWAPLRDPRDRAPAFADADIPHRVAVFADAYGMTARHRAELAPFAVDMARRYHEDSRTSAELDPVFRKLWEDGAKDELPRAEAWLRKASPAITARLGKLDDVRDSAGY